MKTDYHLHSNHSYDSKTPVELIKKAADEQDIKSIALTEHHEITKVEFLKPFKIRDIDKYLEDCSNYDIIPGIEFGWDCETEIDIDLELFDFVLLSIHGVEDESRNVNWDNYFRNILYAAENVKRYDFLAHLDFPRRYINGYPEVDKKYYPIIEEIFKVLIKNGKGIEINTCGMRLYREPNPGIEILKLYNSVGGKLLTFGSDAHFDYHVGNNISEAMELACDLGFKKMSVFENGDLIQKNIK